MLFHPVNEPEPELEFEGYEGKEKLKHRLKSDFHSHALAGHE